MAVGHGWGFKAKLRARAYGWRGSALAVTRLKEALSEIKAVAKSDPVTAGEGAVSLMERIWPAFQDIDTSSGALGTAVARTLEQLIPILAGAPADHGVRASWLERLFDAVQEDGVQYLAPVEERWGEIARYPDLIHAYADRLLPILRRAWADQERFSHVTGTAICLSCLLEAGRYTELQDLLAMQRMRFWSWHRFGAEALLRRGSGRRRSLMQKPPATTGAGATIKGHRQFCEACCSGRDGARRPTGTTACAPQPGRPTSPSTARWSAPIPTAIGAASCST